MITINRVIKYTTLLSFKKKLIIAAVIYLFLSSISYHPDPTLTMLWASLTKPWDLNIYGYITSHPEENVGMFNYNPLLYLILKIQYFVALIVGGDGYKQWLRLDLLGAADSTQIFRYTFATKLFGVITAFYCAFILYKLIVKKTKSIKRAENAVLLWLLNPISIYAIALMGQNDVYAIALFLTAWLLLERNFIVSLIIFGLSIAVKNYPLVWLVILVSATEFKSIWQKLLSYLIPIGVSLITFLPFISNEGFRNEVINSPLSKRMFISGIEFGFGERVIIVPALLLVLMYIALFLSPKKLTFTQKAFLVFTSNLIILGFTHFHVQWMLWLVPFWIMWITDKQNSRKLVNMMLSAILFISWLLILLMYKDQSLYFGIFAPVSFGLQAYPHLPYVLDNIGVDYKQINDLAYSAIAGTGLFQLVNLINILKIERAE
jgi:hypothetical protein